MPGGINIIDLPNHERKRIRSLSKHGLINECEKLHKRILHIKTRIGWEASNLTLRVDKLNYYHNQINLKGQIFNSCITALEAIINTMHAEFDDDIDAVKMLNVIINALDGSSGELKAQVKALRAIQREA